MGWSLEQWASFATVLGGFAAACGVSGGALFIWRYRVEERRIRDARRADLESAQTLRHFETVQMIRQELSGAYRDLIQFRMQRVTEILSLKPSQVDGAQPLMNYIVASSANALRTVREMAKLVKRDDLSELNGEILEYIRFVLRITEEDTHLATYLSERQIRVIKFRKEANDARMPIMSPDELDRQFYESGANFPIDTREIAAFTHMSGPDSIDHLNKQLEQLLEYYKELNIDNS